jgi:MerR family transcriptional regulator/heat shock protein HspR
MKRRKGFYSISVVAKMFDVHQQTIRLYEKEGLITPHRSDGNTRQFTDEDVDQLERIIHLTHKLGINLAGVEMILKLQKKIDRLQSEINKAFDITKDELEKDAEKLALSAQEDSRQLIALKKGSTHTPLLEKIEGKTTRRSTATLAKNKKSVEPEVDAGDLKIDYEDL